MKEILSLGFAAKKYIQEESVKLKKHSVSKHISGNPTEGYIKHETRSHTDNDPETDDSVESEVSNVNPDEEKNIKDIILKNIIKKNQRNCDF